MSWVRNFRRHVWHFEPRGSDRFLCGSNQRVGPNGLPGGLAIELPRSYRLCKNCERMYGHYYAGALSYVGQARR